MWKGDKTLEGEQRRHRTNLETKVLKKVWKNGFKGRSIGIVLRKKLI